MEMNWFVRGARPAKKDALALPEPLKLSNSMMKVVEECRLCGWLHARGRRRPSIPVAGITHGIDRTAKDLCNLHRRAGTLPLVLSAGLTGSFCPDTPYELGFEDSERKCIVRGRLDEIFMERN